MTTYTDRPGSTVYVSSGVCRGFNYTAIRLDINTGHVEPVEIPIKNAA